MKHDYHDQGAHEGHEARDDRGAHHGHGDHHDQAPGPERRGKLGAQGGLLVAEAVAAEIAIDTVFAEVLPDQKAEKIR